MLLPYPEELFLAKQLHLHRHLIASGSIRGPALCFQTKQKEAVVHCGCSFQTV